MQVLNTPLKTCLSDIKREPVSMTGHSEELVTCYCCGDWQLQLPKKYAKFH